MVDLTSRSLEPELLDLSRPDPDRLERFYGFLRFVNIRLGGTRALRRALEGFSVHWPRGRTIWVLDVATGTADVPKFLIDWARKEGYSLRIVGLDREEDTLALARRHLQGYPEVLLVRAAAQSLPFRGRPFDYVISTLFFHHLNGEEALISLQHFDRLARRGILITDLLRRRRLYWWTQLFSLFCERLLRYDNLLSVRKAFTLSEVEALTRKVGLDYLEIHPAFGHRFILSGEK